MSWTFHDTIQVDVLACESEERKRKLMEHFRTRTTHESDTIGRFVSGLSQSLRI